MTAQKGKDLLVKFADGAGYTTVAGLRTRRLSFNAETVDITDAESPNRSTAPASSAPRLPAQPIDATQALNLSAGVSNCKVFRGRSLS